MIPNSLAELGITTPLNGNSLSPQILSRIEGGLLIPKAIMPFPPSSGPWWNAWMSYKILENVMEVMVKIEKINTMTKTKTDKDKNVRE